MAISKETLPDLLKFFGLKVNADAIEEISTNEKDYPDNWDEMGEEEQAAWKAKQAKMKDNSADDDEDPDPEPARKPAKQNARQAQDPVGNQPDVTNLLKLNALIEEIGGFDAYKGLLLSAVEAVENYQNRSQDERAGLVSAIVTNSAGQFEEADLEDVGIPTLKKMASAFGHDVTVDYSALNTGSVKANKDDIATMPDLVEIFQNEAKAKEKED